VNRGLITVVQTHRLPARTDERPARVTGLVGSTDLLCHKFYVVYIDGVEIFGLEPLARSHDARDDARTRIVKVAFLGTEPAGLCQDIVGTEGARQKE
jgi:hypothetical protein